MDLIVDYGGAQPVLTYSSAMLHLQTGRVQKLHLNGHIQKNDVAEIVCQNRCKSVHAPRLQFRRCLLMVQYSNLESSLAMSGKQREQRMCKVAYSVSRTKKLSTSRELSLSCCRASLEVHGSGFRGMAMDAHIDALSVHSCIRASSSFRFCHCKEGGLCT